MVLPSISFGKILSLTTNLVSFVLTCVLIVLFPSACSKGIIFSVFCSVIFLFIEFVVFTTLESVSFVKAISSTNSSALFVVFKAIKSFFEELFLIVLFVLLFSSVCLNCSLKLLSVFFAVFVWVMFSELLNSIIDLSTALPVVCLFSLSIILSPPKLSSGVLVFSFITAFKSLFI